MRSASNRASLSAALRGVVERLESRTLLAAAGPDPFGYVADPHPFENINLDPGDPAVSTTSFINADQHNFNLYGHSGFLSLQRNGIILFNASDRRIGENLTVLDTGPFVRAIAPLWSSVTHDGGAVHKFENTGGPDARPDRLIIEWDLTPRASSNLAGPLRFQVILELNTGDRPGDIIFNYAEMESANPANTTVGIKDAGFQSNRLLLATNDVDTDLIGEGKAVRIHNPSTGQPVANTGGPHTQPEGSSDVVVVTVNGLETTDPNQASDSLTYAWDFDLDGRYGETGVGARRGKENGSIRDFIDLNPGAGAQGTKTYPIALRVTDASGFVSHDDGAVMVTNVRPSRPTITAPATATPGVPISITANAADSGNDVRGFRVDWGDDSEQFYEVTNVGLPATILHTYYTPGTHTITVTAMDHESAESDPVTHIITISALPDRDLSDEGFLMVSGTAAADDILLDRNGDDFRLTRNGVVTTHPVADVKGLVIDAGGGSDSVAISITTGEIVRVTLLGGAGNDTLHTTAAEARVYGGAGDDDLTSEGNFGIVRDAEGSNTVHMGAGRITTGDGNDVITSTDSVRVFSGGGNDFITTGGSDTIDCGTGADTVMAGDLSDRIFATGDAATGIGAFIDAGDAPDEVYADFATTIHGGAGTDIIGVQRAREINGGDDDDTIRIDVSANRVDAGAGDDLVRFNSSAANPAVVFGGDGDDTLYSDAGRDSLYGGAGNDRLAGGIGSDLLSGGGGSDRLFGHGGADRLYAGSGTDRLFGHAGDDRLTGGGAADTIDGGRGTDSADEQDAADVLASIEKPLT